MAIGRLVPPHLGEDGEYVKPYDNGELKLICVFLKPRRYGQGGHRLPEPSRLHHRDAVHARWCSRRDSWGRWGPDPPRSRWDSALRRQAAEAAFRRVPRSAATIPAAWHDAVRRHHDINGVRRLGARRHNQGVTASGQDASLHARGHHRRGYGVRLPGRSRRSIDLPRVLGVAVVGTGIVWFRHEDVLQALRGCGA